VQRPQLPEFQSDDLRLSLPGIHPLRGLFASPRDSNDIRFNRARFPSSPPPRRTLDGTPTLATWKCSDQIVSSTPTASAFDVDPELLLLPTVDRNPSKTPRSVNFFIVN